LVFTTVAACHAMALLLEKRQNIFTTITKLLLQQEHKQELA
jgi:hypothetical protein